MAASSQGGVQYIGTTAAPIALGAAGGATDVWTWNHNQGKRALCLQVLSATDRQELDEVTVGATQPTVNQMVLTHLTAGTVNCVLRVTWEDLSESVCVALPSTVGTLS